MKTCSQAPFTKAISLKIDCATPLGPEVTWIWRASRCNRLLCIPSQG